MLSYVLSHVLSYVVLCLSHVLSYVLSYVLRYGTQPLPYARLGADLVRSKHHGVAYRRCRLDYHG